MSTHNIRFYGEMSKIIPFINTKYPPVPLHIVFQFLTDCGYHWRLAKNTFHLSQIYGAQGYPEKKKEYIYMAKDISTTALGLDDQCANSHKW